MIWSNFVDLWYNVKYLTFYDAKEKYEFKWEEFCMRERISDSLILNTIKLLVRAYKIARFCRENGIDMCLSHMEEANFSNIISKILFWNRSKIFVQIHQSINAWWKLYQVLIQSLYNKADKIITIAKEEKENLVKNYSINRTIIEVIYNPIDIKKITALVGEDLWTYAHLFGDQKFTFINIWRLTHQKNQEILLRAFDTLNRKYQDTRLIILGDGDLKNELCLQRESLHSKWDIFFLWNQQNPYKFLHNSDCFVFTSRYEWFWIVILEAMSCWLPVISTDCKTWPKEILRRQMDTFDEAEDMAFEEYGILIPSDDEMKLFEAMETIYLDRDTQVHYKQKSLERAQDFKIEKIFIEWQEL